VDRAAHGREHQDLVAVGQQPRMDVGQVRYSRDRTGDPLPEEVWAAGGNQGAVPEEVLGEQTIKMVDAVLAEDSLDRGLHNLDVPLPWLGHHAAPRLDGWGPLPAAQQAKPERVCRVISR
jgi:hypothetical protein